MTRADRPETTPRSRPASRRTVERTARRERPGVRDAPDGLAGRARGVVFRRTRRGPRSSSRPRGRTRRTGRASGSTAAGRACRTTATDRSRRPGLAAGGGGRQIHDDQDGPGGGRLRRGGRSQRLRDETVSARRGRSSSVRRLDSRRSGPAAIRGRACACGSGRRGH
jgi:hypothetical protein